MRACVAVASYAPNRPCQVAPKSVIRGDLRLARESSGGSGCQKIPLVTMTQANCVAGTLQSICMADAAIFFECKDPRKNSYFAGCRDCIAWGRCTASHPNG